MRSRHLLGAALPGAAIAGVLATALFPAVLIAALVLPEPGRREPLCWPSR
jgi:hypothetical protein